MKISRNWLTEFVDLSKFSDQEIAEKLTMTIAEVEGVTNLAEKLAGVVVGEVLEIRKHPNADKLHTARMKVGKRKTIQVIFGQMISMQVGQRVPVAIAPTTLPTGATIEKKELRGVVSEGMLCLDQELGLADVGVSIRYFPDVEPGTPIAEALGLTDAIYHVDNKSLTHRGDLFSHIGIARELAAAFGRAMNNARYETVLRFKKLKTVGIQIQDPASCARFVGTVLKVKLGESPDFIQQRLASCGVRSRNNVVDITNYVMLELGEPLHAYDYDALRARAGDQQIQISVRFATKGEQITTLDGRSRTCSSDVQLIADARGGLGVAGIMGGKDTEVSDATTTIVLEAAQFHPIVTRKAARYLGLRTEGAMRWEKGLSPELAAHATHRAIELLKEYAGAEVVEGPEDVYATKPARRAITLRPSYISKLLGFDVESQQITESLERLGAEVRSLAKVISVTPPWWRQDLRIEEDLVEEVGRVVGLQHIPETPMVGELVGVEKDAVLEWGSLMLNTCVRAGMTEVKNYAFYGDRELERAGVSADEHLKLLNSLSSDLSVLRTTLLIGLMRNAVQNQRDVEKISLCEFGHTFLDKAEPRLLSGLIAGSSSSAFFDAKGIVEAIASGVQKAMRVTSLDVAPETLHIDQQLLNVSAAGTILFADKPVGVIGLIREDIARAFKSERELAVFSMDIAAVAGLASRYGTYTSGSAYPAVKRDVSFVIPSTISYEEVCATINKAGAPELERLDLFDIYEGGKLPVGQRSFAFHLSYRSPLQTLTAEDAEKIHERVTSALVSRHRAEIR